MGKIFCYYSILNAQHIYNPRDTIIGIFVIENKGKEGKKDQKLKKVEIHLTENYEEFVVTQTTRSKMVVVRGKATMQKVPETHSEWHTRSKTLAKYQMKTVGLIKSGEIKEFPFEIQLPTTWTPKISGNLRDWHLALEFKQKTGMTVNLGSNPESAYYVLPVYNSTRPPSSSSSASETKLEKEYIKSVESQNLQKLAGLFKISSKIKIDDLVDILNLKRSLLIDKLIEWSDKFSFKIDGDFLTVSEESVSDFIEALEKQFANWGETEEQKISKK